MVKDPVITVNGGPVYKVFPRISSFTNPLLFTPFSACTHHGTYSLTYHSRITTALHVRTHIHTTRPQAQTITPQDEAAVLALKKTTEALIREHMEKLVLS